MKINIHKLLQKLLDSLKGKTVRIGGVDIELDKSKGADTFGSDRDIR